MRPGSMDRPVAGSCPTTALSLREKQKLKRMYGLAERQFRGYYHKATRMKGVAGEILLQLLERRLDNVVYRLALPLIMRRRASSSVTDNFIVNGKKVNVPSFLCSASAALRSRRSPAR